MFATWDQVTGPDLHQHFQIDDRLDTTWDAPWWWLRSRILALLDEDTRLARTVRALTE